MNDETRGDPEGTDVSRRDFLKALGGGILICITLGPTPAEGADPGPARALPTDFNAFLRVGADGRITGYTGKIEMGQGVITSLAQALADELDVPVSHVDMRMGDTDLCPYDQGTWGSLTTRFFAPALRKAAAEARAVLLALAAERLGVPQERLVVVGGVVSDPRDKSHKVTYAQLAQGKVIERHLQGEPKLKSPAEFKVMGKPVKRVDSIQKVTGRAHYTADIRLPGLLYARVLRPPSHASRLKRVDVSALKGDPDLKVVQDPHVVAVLHPHPDMATRALSRIKAEYETPPSSLDNGTLFKHLVDAAPREGEVFGEAGSLLEGEMLARRVFDETWCDHYVAHAAMETHAALARFEGDRLTVWASTQNPFGVRDEVSRTLGIPVAKVRVITPFVGGAFGGKSFNLQAVEAARLAQLTGRPVQVMWTRKEEFFLDAFRPAAVIKIRSGVDESGTMVLWKYDVYHAGSRGAELLYAVPHHKSTSFGGWRGGGTGVHPFRVGPWRAPGNSTNTFARESHLDMMAARLVRDPLEFRLAHLKDPRMLATLNAVAARFGWKKSAAPSKRGQGVACGTDAGTYVAVMAEVEVDVKSGQVKVKRLACAQDMGFVVNPEGARMQMEGCLMMGLGYALAEQVEFQGGQVLTENFGDYEVPRFSWMPRLDTVFVDNPTLSSQGGGEPAVTCVGGAVANAIFDATGARLHQMAMTPDRVREALKGVRHS